jgi:hypothetical protein
MAAALISQRLAMNWGEIPLGQSKLAVALVGAELRHRMIAETAYFRAKRRGFEPGHALDDWLAAEAEVDTSLTIGVLPSVNFG